MQYARVKFYSPARKRLSRIDPEEDHLHGDVWDDQQLLASAESTLDEELLQKCSRRGLRSIWVKQPQYEWRRVRDDTTLRGEVVERRNVSPVRHQLLSGLPSIESPTALEDLINEYEQSDVGEMICSKLVTTRQLLNDLIEQEKQLVERLDDIEEDLGPLIDELNSRNPDLNPDRYSDKKLVRDLTDFVNNMNELRRSIAEIILEADEEATPDAALIKQQHRSVYQVLTESDEAPVSSPQLAHERLQDHQNTSGFDPAELFLTTLHELLSGMTLSGTFNNEGFDRALRVLREHDLPCSYWLMPYDTTEMHNLFEDAVGRLVLYDHLFGEQLHNDPMGVGVALLGCDLGLLNIPEANWLHEDELRDRQRSAIEEHAQKSIELLDELGVLNDEVAELVRTHHAPDESSDSRATRVALCDRYVSLTAERGYRDALGPARAIKDIEKDLSAEPLRETLTEHPPATLILQETQAFFVRRVEGGVRWHGDVLDRTDDGFEFDRRSTIHSPPDDTPGHRVVPWTFRRRML